MANIHDRFVIELREVILAYGNDPTIEEPFRLPRDYKFYEMPGIAISEEWFKNMLPLEVVMEKECAPERKTAEWVYGENDGQDGWYCSECHFFIPWYYDWYGLDNIDFIKDFHTCPHCDAKMVTYTGAKMDGGAG